MAGLPDAIHLKTTFATFNETYRMTGGSLASEFTLAVLKPKVEPEEWKSVKEFADAIGVQPWIQLQSQTVSTGEPGPPVAAIAIASRLIWYSRPPTPSRRKSTSWQ